MFNEDNTIEQMSVEALASLGWRYVAAEDLPRRHADVMVEPMVKDALIRLNPEIAEDPDRADEIIYRLRALIQSTSPQNLVSTNERFKKLVIEENSFPYGKDGRMVPIRFFGTAADGDLDKNEYIVTNQWVYPPGTGRQAPRPRPSCQWISARHRRAQDAGARFDNLARRRWRHR